MPTIATLGAASARAFGLFGSTAVTDPYFFYNTLLLPGNGTNGAQNNTFLDSSTNNFTITRNGNTTQGTFTPYGSNWSNFFSSSQLSVANSTNLDLGSGNWTIEAWLYPTSFAANARFFSKQVSSGLGFLARLQTTTGYVFLEIDQTGIVTSSTAPALNTWSHVAIVRSSNTVTIYINGTSAGSASYSGTPSSQTAKTTVSGFDSGPAQGEYFPGYISNLRFVKGSAVYTSNFTPSTAPLTAITNTQLLTCQNNRFIDNSSNAFTVTVNVGSPSVQRFSPFNPSAPYAAGTIGGSGYFDGSGDYLTAPDNAAWSFGSGNFTVEAWYYPTGTSSQQVIVGQWSGSSGSTTLSWILFTSNNSSVFLRAAASSDGSGVLFDLVSTSPLILNAWNHVALVRSGNTFQLYLNGSAASSGSTTSSAALFDATNALSIGATSAGGQLATGYISDVRILKGTAQYTGATYTVPTAPLTAITNTQLLTNFTNGGIIDNAMMNDLETVGNAQISTTQSKFGGASLYFDGSSWLYDAAGLLDFGTGDFTIEFWVYRNSTANGGLLRSGGSTTSGSTGQYFLLFESSNTTLTWQSRVGVTNQWGVSSTPLTTSAWHHIAVVRQSGVFKVFFNGTSQSVASGSFTDSTSYSCAQASVGGNFSGYNFNGYIDDLRITKGYARYTANFTPPTAAFPLS